MTTMYHCDIIQSERKHSFLMSDSAICQGQGEWEPDMIRYDSHSIYSYILMLFVLILYMQFPVHESLFR